MKRNRQQTEQRIVQAAINLLGEDGFAGFGINAVAARAGVDKVLIYRYFSGLDGLLNFIGRTEVLFPSAAAMLDTDLIGFFRNYSRALKTNRLACQLHGWERVANNPLTQAFRRQREVFWNDAASLLRPQNESARCLLSLLAALPPDSTSPENLRPLTTQSEYTPVETPSRIPTTKNERLADNLL